MGKTRIRASAEAMCAELAEPVRSRATELAENVLWMEAKLTEARRAIGKTTVAIPYDNGGGQRGVRRNPAFDGYNALMAQYVKALNQLCAMLGEAASSQPASGKLKELRKSAKRLKG